MDHSNKYTKSEDELLWEIHEVRHGISDEIEEIGTELFNKELREKFEGFVFIKSQRAIGNERIG